MCDYFFLPCYFITMSQTHGFFLTNRAFVYYKNIKKIPTKILQMDPKKQAYGELYCAWFVLKGFI